MKTQKVCFKKICYGEEKDTILAVLLNDRNTTVAPCFSLFEGLSNKPIAYLRVSTKNATEKEYISTLTALQKEYGDCKIEILISLKH